MSPGAVVVHEDDLVEEGGGARVDHAPHGPNQCRPGGGKLNHIFPSKIFHEANANGADIKS